MLVSASFTHQNAVVMQSTTEFAVLALKSCCYRCVSCRVRFDIVTPLAQLETPLSSVLRSITAALGVQLPRGWAGPSHTDAGHRDCVLIGTAAGLAAAFSTPVGGLLLAIEQVLATSR